MGKIINLRMGLIGAFLMGGIVFYINYESQWEEALVAALKQGTYTLFFGGIVIRLSEYLSLKYPSKIKSLATATILPAFMAIFATYLVHQIKGTPKPIESLVPTILLSFPAFLFIGLRKRTQNDKQNQSDASTAEVA